MLAAAVRRGLRTPLLVGDMPFGSYEQSNEQAVANAQRFVKEAGCDAVKLERGGASVDRARAIVRAGIPVMGHVGLTPQTATALGGYKAQGQDRRAARRRSPRRRSRCRRPAASRSCSRPCPAAVTEALMPKMEIPVIGIGAGAATDGQVLVFHDLLGIFGGHAAKFVKRYADVRGEMVSGVRPTPPRSASGAFPGPEHIYAIEPGRAGRVPRLSRAGELAARPTGTGRQPRSEFA